MSDHDTPLDDDLDNVEPAVDPTPSSTSGDETAEVATISEQEAVEQLRAADPAATLEASAAFASKVVDRMTSGPRVGAEPEIDDAAASAAQAPPAVIDLAAQRERRRPRWHQVVAGVAAAGLIGVGGYVVGAGALTAGMGGGDSASAESAADAGAGPEMAGGQPMAESAPDAGEGGSGSGLAGADERMASGASDTSMPYFGRHTFSSAGFSTEAGTAVAYGLDARIGSLEEVGQRIAAAFGVEGEGTVSYGSWNAGSTDGTGPSVYVGLDGTLNFGFTNSSIDPWLCGWSDGGVEPATAEEPAHCETNPVLPGPDEATTAMVQTLELLGENPGDFVITIPETYEGAVTRQAVATRTLGGLTTDLTFYLDYTADGVYSFSGSAAAVVELGDYAIVSPQEGFERLSDVRFGAQQTVWPMQDLAREGTIQDSEVWVEPTEAPAPVAPGAPLSWPVTDVSIVDHEIVLAQQWQPDGAVMLVPTYRFTDADGGVWSVIALAEDHLDVSAD